MTAKLVFNDYVRVMDEQFSLYEWCARQHGLQHKSMQILFWIKNYPEMTGAFITQKVLAEKTYSSKQVVHATIKSWREKGYVVLLENLQDKRHKLIQLTEAGQAFATEIYAQITDIETRAISGLTPEEQALLIQLTYRYNQDLKAEIEVVYDKI